ncbi:MAG: hypothetical protein EZS28_053888, partial [Streblomastix strix]
AAGTSIYYARADHSHPNLYSTIKPIKDTGTGVVGTTTYYARADHAHAANYNTLPLSVPAVNQGVGSNGIATYYARSDHIHPQQLTYTDSIMATAFIRTHGLSTQVLLGDGHVKVLDTFVLWGDSTTGLWENDNVLYYNGKQVLLAD